MIRTLIAEDQHVIREALIALLQLEDDIEVVAGVDRGDAIVPAALEHAPDVALLDIDLPGTDGLTAAGELHARAPTIKVLILTGLPQPGHLLRALEHGVRGFLPKDAESADLADAVRRVAAGERVIDPTMVADALETGRSPLTPREADVLRVADSGRSTEQIGDELALSPATVRNYLSNAMAKVGGRNRIDAVRIAREAGWL